MFRIRYYESYYHPHQFSAGLRGWYIRLVNWVRWKVELHVQKQVVKYLANGKPVDVKRAILDSFMVDVKTEANEYLRTSPRVRLGGASLIQNTIDGRYQRPESKDPRPMIARMSADPRTRRYARGRSMAHLVELEDVIGAEEKA